MKSLYYLNYFFYIGFNWNFKLALFTVIHEIRGEKKYGVETVRLNDLKKLTIKGNNLVHAEMYQGSNYYLLENLFGYLQGIKATSHIVDFGCGKGRALVVAAYFGFDKITGIEFARELCNIAKRNIIPVQQKFPGKIFNIMYLNAVDYEVEDDTDVFFFFNPFKEVVMLAVVKNILQSLKSNPRDIYAVYMNPVHKEIFLSAGFEEVFHFEKMYYATAVILKKSPEDFGAFDEHPNVL